MKVTSPAWSPKQLGFTPRACGGLGECIVLDPPVERSEAPSLAASSKQ